MQEAILEQIIARVILKLKEANIQAPKEVIGQITQEIVATLSDLPRPHSEAPEKSSPLRWNDCLHCEELKKYRPGSHGRAVVTCTGQNHTGIVSRITQAIADLNGDIQDISQTIIGGFFTMIIIVDLGGIVQSGASFKDFQERISETGKEMGLDIMVNHEDILKAMHRI